MCDGEILFNTLTGILSLLYQHHKEAKHIALRAANLFHQESFVFAHSRLDELHLHNPLK